MAQHDAVQDRNRVHTLLALQGSTGTANTGTETVAVGADETTGAIYVYNLAPAGSLSVGSITVSAIDSVGTINTGTITAVEALPDLPGGTIDQITGGSIVVTAGTVTTTLALNTGTITTGSLAAIGQVHNAGTIAGLPDLPGGTIDQITGGSIVVTAGTVTTTLALDTGTITTGSLAAIGQVHNAGTVAALPDLPGGTIDQITTGSIVVTAGTVTTTLALDTGTITTGSLANIGYIHEIGTMPAISIGESTGGTLDLITRVGNVGTLEVGTVTVSNPTGTTVTVDHGTITLSNPTGTTVQFNNGTVNLLNAGTITRLENGTIGLVTRVGNVGTIEVGTISTLPNIPGGTLGVVSAVSMLNAGTLTTIPNIPGGTIGVVSNITNGTIRITAGTVNSLVGGTLGLVTTVTNLSNGTIQSSGTTTGVGTVSNIAVVHNAGTVQNINFGTVRLDPRPSKNVLTYGTTFAGTAAAYGTLVGSAAVGAGTYTWVQDISVNNPYGTVRTMVGFGTALQGTSCLVNGIFGTQTGVGIQKSYSDAVNAGMTNQDLVVYIGGAGTVDVNVSYYISA